MNLPDRERIYTDEEIVQLLEKAAHMGLVLDAGCKLEEYTVGELERLVTVVQ